MVVGNFVNFMAASRAWRMFLVGKALNRKLVWDKTMHDFPSTDLVAAAPRKLGSVLLSWQAINDTNLQTALDEQQTRHMPLGRILLSHGWLDDETLAEAIAFQNDLPRVFDVAHKADASLLTDEFALRWRVVPLGLNEEGRAQIAVASPLTAEGLQQISAELGSEPVQLIARESEIVAQLRNVNAIDGQSVPNAKAPLLGDLLIEMGLLDRDVFSRAMLNYRPQHHGRIGDYLVDIGVLPRATIEQAVARQHSHYPTELPA